MMCSSCKPTPQLTSLPQGRLVGVALHSAARHGSFKFDNREASEKAINTRTSLQALVSHHI